MDKFFSKSDWRIRPIPEGMLDYARCDSHYLIPMYLYLLKLINPFLFEKDEDQLISPTGKVERLPKLLHMSPELYELAKLQAPNNWLEHIRQIL